MSSWYEEAVFYQFYPMGITGAPEHNGWDWSGPWNGALAPTNRLEKTLNNDVWIEHLKKLGVNAVYFSPVFQSDRHGYDTRDYYTIDSRLGSNEDFARLCKTLHQNHIRVVLDGVFNHVGRGFWAFRDVQQHKQNSVYKDWFYIDWNRNSYDNDGFWYEGWEGHFDLVKLNLKNPAVVEHLFGAIKKWVELFNIDGIRLDVAYCLDDDFLRQLGDYTAQFSSDFVLIGEIIYAHDMHRVNTGLLHSCTNYECYKGLWSSLNTKNMFELAHSLKRLFGHGGLFFQKQLMNFVDNHDVSRIASQIKNKAYLPLVYGILFGMPGTPSIYYGSEWGVEGKKEKGDGVLRPKLESPAWNSLSNFIAKLAFLRHTNPALQTGAYEQLMLTNTQFIFKRSTHEQEIVVCVNLDENKYVAHPKGKSSDGGYKSFDGLYGTYTNAYTDEKHHFNGCVSLPPVSVLYYKKA
ncbi:MAG TPA: alpha-amylase family glycosyl hydrolase [Treponemataceae bacterium]|nr:alpha-amylase family glycosyl hydrolase [Treponemataceae bacterium]